MMLMMTVAYAMYAFGFVFIVCEIAQRVCDTLNGLDRVIGQMDWYLYPNEIQKFLPLILLMVQKPFELRCLGSMECGRELYKKVPSHQSIIP